MKKNILRHLARGVFLLTLILASCETTNLDLQNNPNTLSPEQADPTFVLNSIQLQFGNQSSIFAGITSDIMRHVNMRDPYANNAPATSMNGVWNIAYQITSNLNLLKERGLTENLNHHIAVGQILESYSYANLVDYIGTAVYSQAVNQSEFPNPDLDTGEDIYNDLYNKLDEAITLLNTSDAAPFEDLYYGGSDNSINQWIKLANTLKLRMYIQSKLVLDASQQADLSTIISSGNYINSSADDFQIRYGSRNNNPDTRHPYYISEYVTNSNLFMSNGFMNRLLNSKTTQDPRTKYFFYRQDLNDPNPDDIEHCTSWVCYIGGGYFGRGHGDDEGIPNVGDTKTTYGIYPGGGAYDAAGSQTEEIAIANSTFVCDTSSSTSCTEQLQDHIENHLATVNNAALDGEGLSGAGIQPILTSFFVKFLLAESSLPTPFGLATTGNTRSLLESGVRESLEKVENFAGIEMMDSQVDDYINNVLTNYDNATTDEDRLAVIIEELYISSFGNSTEAYNAYRRTGFPSDLQEHVLSSGGDFPRSFFLPDSEINSNDNPNLVQKSLTDKVFWDTNPDGFIK